MSLLLFMATCELWVRSYGVMDKWILGQADATTMTIHQFNAVSDSGGLLFERIESVVFIASEFNRIRPYLTGHWRYTRFAPSGSLWPAERVPVIGSLGFRYDSNNKRYPLLTASAVVGVPARMDIAASAGTTPAQAVVQ
jgi:hypothetical protein